MVPVFGVSQHNPSKNRERGGALALGGCRLLELGNNQPKVGGSVRGDDIAEASLEESAGGYSVQ